MSILIAFLPVIIGMVFGFKHYTMYDIKYQRKIERLKQLQAERQTETVQMPGEPTPFKRVLESVLVAVGVGLLCYGIMVFLLMGACFFMLAAN